MAKKSEARITQILSESLPSEQVLRSMIKNIQFTIEKATQVLNTPIVDGSTRQAAAKEVERATQLLTKYEQDLKTLLTVESKPEALRKQHENKLPDKSA